MLKHGIVIWVCLCILLLGWQTLTKKRKRTTFFIKKRKSTVNIRLTYRKAVRQRYKHSNGFLVIKKETVDKKISLDFNEKLF